MNPDQLLLVVLAARLTPRQVDAFIDHVVLERRLADVAAEYGVSRAAIGQFVKKARRKMQKVVLAEAA